MEHRALGVHLPRLHRADRVVNDQLQNLRVRVGNGGEVQRWGGTADISISPLSAVRRIAHTAISEATIVADDVLIAPTQLAISACASTASNLMSGCAQPDLSRTLVGIASREGCTAGVEGRRIEWRRPAPPRPSCRRPGMAARLGWRTPWLCSTGPRGT
jgi:hypothetical protein